MMGIALVRESRFTSFDKLQAVDLRQLEVEQNETRGSIEAAAGERPTAEEEIERFGAVAHQVDLVGQLALFERVDGELRVGGIVFHQQDFNDFRFDQESPRFLNGVRAVRPDRRA